MSRPQKKGIDYFPFDVGFFDSKQIKVLKGRYGSDGITLYLYILCEIYKENGYYLQIDDDFNYITASDIGMEDNKIGQILNFLCKRSLLDGTLFVSDKVLTSHGIQSRYQEAVRTRASKTPVMVIKKYWVLDDSETLPFIKFINSCDSSGKNVHSSEKNEGFYKEKRHKVKESKLNKRKEEEDAASAVVASYESNIGSISGVVYDKLTSWVDVVDESLVLYAIEQAALNGKRTYSYIEAILNNHFKSGRKTRAEAELASRNRSEKTADKPKSRYDYEEFERKCFFNLHKDKFTEPEGEED